MSEAMTVRAIVMGRVQGVWFRASTRDRANHLGVTGWARNLPDGTVEIVAQGEDAQVQALMEWARQGPPQARVTDLRVEELSDSVELKEFEVRY